MIISLIFLFSLHVSNEIYFLYNRYSYVDCPSCKCTAASDTVSRNEEKKPEKTKVIDKEKTFIAKGEMQREKSPISQPEVIDTWEEWLDDNGRYFVAAIVTLIVFLIAIPSLILFNSHSSSKDTEVDHPDKLQTKDEVVPSKKID